MDQQQSTDHNSETDHKPTVEGKKNVVGALLEHFKKWHPEKLTNACGIQEMRETRTSTGQEQE